MPLTPKTAAKHIRRQRAEYENAQFRRIALLLSTVAHDGESTQATLQRLLSERHSIAANILYAWLERFRDKAAQDGKSNVESAFYTVLGYITEVVNGNPQTDQSTNDELPATGDAEVVEDSGS